MAEVIVIQSTKSLVLNVMNIFLTIPLLFYCELPLFYCTFYLPSYFGMLIFVMVLHYFFFLF